MVDPANPYHAPSATRTAVAGNEQIVPVIITAIDGATAHGEMRVRQLGSGARAWRAARVLALCLVIALAFVCVPILHWVLVPGMFLAGPIIAAHWLKYDRAVVGGTGTCPACASALTLGRATHPEGFGVACRACRSSLRVAPV